MESASLSPSSIVAVASRSEDYKQLHEYYTEEYFIQKFQGIPAKKICSYDLEYMGAHCALGWCGVKENLTNQDFDLTEEAIELELLVRVKTCLAMGGNYLNVSAINDGLRQATKLGRSPKERILVVLTLSPKELRAYLTDETTT